MLTASGITSMTLETTTETDMESSKANDIIKSQFQKSVSNNSLVLVINTDDASSIETQKFIEELTWQINESSDITGIENVTNVYSILIPVLNQTNKGVYTAYYGGNLTYNLLYSVPTIYSNVWFQAYNTTKYTQLIPGLNQTNQGVYLTLDNANMTYYLLYSVPAVYSGVWAGAYTSLQSANLTCNLLYGTPAMYLNAWTQAMGSTSGNIDLSNTIANQTTADTLNKLDPTTYTQYTSGLLEAYHTVWTQSFQDTSTSTWTPTERASYASNLINHAYINTYLSGNETAQTFVTAFTNSCTFDDYLNNADNQTQVNIALTNFALQYITLNSPHVLSLTDFVEAPPESNNLDYYTKETLNQAAYDQTAAILLNADPTAFDQYTSPLLYAFNISWVTSFQNPLTQTFTSTERASLAANLTNQQYIETALAGNTTMQEFAKALIHTFSLDSFLFNTVQQNEAQIRSFSIAYVANQSKSPIEFVDAAYDLGRDPSNIALANLADNVIWYSQSYGMAKFIQLFNSISYDQTSDILKDLDEDSFNDYTSHMLDYFNASWCSYVPKVFLPPARWVNQTASIAADSANAQFIPIYLSDGEEFANKIASELKLPDYLSANTAYTNSKLLTLTVNYIANESGLSEELITAIYDAGENASNNALQTLASQIIKNPTAYNIGNQFNSLITSFVSPSRNVTLISITFTESGDENLEAIRKMIAEMMATNQGNVHSVKVTGSDAINYDFRESTYNDLELILPITIALLIIATAVFFRSIVIPIVTLGTIGIGLGVSQIFPYLIGTYINPVDYTVSTVLVTVLIGVGTDYSIFILARHREERINGLPLFEAIKKSITWAGESIVTSGATVIISFFALAATSMVMLQTMGLVVGLGVIVTLIASLTFAPALTAILGDRIFWPNSGERFERFAKSVKAKNQLRNGYFARSGSFSVKHSKAIILIAVLVTVPAFYVYATTEPTYNLLGSASDSLESVSASNTMTNSFGGGRLMPTYLVVTFTDPIVDDIGRFNMGEMATLGNISSMIVNHEGIHEVSGPTMPYGSTVNYSAITNDTDPTTYNTILNAIGEDKKSALITIKFTVDPYSTEAMEQAQSIRNILQRDYNNVANVTGTYLGGTTGGVLDTKVTFDNQFNSILPIVALGVGIVLFFVLGSLLLPIFAVLSVLMSIVWTLAVTLLVFQSAYSYGLLFITPLILFVLLLGIGMDYNIFILTRIREEAAKGQKLTDAIVNAIQQTGGIITAAAIILAGSLATLLISSNMMLKEMGFAFALSILIDALIVRTYLVPAVMATFGKWNWYNPVKRLRRMEKDNEPSQKAV